MKYPGGPEDRGDSEQASDLGLIRSWFHTAARQRYPGRTSAIPVSTVTVKVSLRTRTPSTIATTGSK